MEWRGREKDSNGLVAKLSRARALPWEEAFDWGE